MKPIPPIMFIRNCGTERRDAWLIVTDPSTRTWPFRHTYNKSDPFRKMLTGAQSVCFSA